MAFVLSLSELECSTRMLRIGEMFGEFSVIPAHSGLQTIEEAARLGVSKWQIQVLQNDAIVHDEEISIARSFAKVVKLRSSTLYSIRTRLFSQPLAAWGPWSREISTRTYPSVICSTTELGEDHVRVSWDRQLRDTTGITTEPSEVVTEAMQKVAEISQFQLRIVREVDMREEFLREFAPGVRSCTVQDLQPATAYILSMRYTTLIGTMKQWTEVCRFMTQPAHRLRIVHRSEDVVRVKWERPPLPSHLDTGYLIGDPSVHRIELLLEGRDILSEPVTVAPPIDEYTFANLKPGTEYCVKFRYITKEGRWSSRARPLNFRTVDRVLIHCPFVRETFANIAWLRNKDEAEVEQLVQVRLRNRTTGRDKDYELKPVASESRVVVLSGLTSGTMYEVRLRTRLNAGLLGNENDNNNNNNNDKKGNDDSNNNDSQLLMQQQQPQHVAWGLWSAPLEFVTRSPVQCFFADRGEDFLGISWKPTDHHNNNNPESSQESPASKNLSVTSPVSAGLSTAAPTPTPQALTRPGTQISHHSTATSTASFEEERKWFAVVQEEQADGTWNDLISGEVKPVGDPGSCRVEALNPDTRYQAKVRAMQYNPVTKETIWGEFCNPFVARTLRSVTIQLVDVGEDFADCMWSRALASQDGGEENWVDLRYELVLANVDKGDDRMIHREVLTNSFVLSNLRPNTNYMLSVRACDENNQWGKWCVLNFQTLSPVALDIHQVGEDYARLFWKRREPNVDENAGENNNNNNNRALQQQHQNNNNTSTADPYVAQYCLYIFSDDEPYPSTVCPDSNYKRGGKASIRRVYTLAPQHTSFRIVDLDPDRIYVAVIRAATVSNKWGPWSTEVKFRTVAPFRIPVNQLSVGENYVSLVWSRDDHPLVENGVIVGDYAATSQQVRVTGIDKPFEVQNTMPPDQRSWKVFGLEPATAYAVRIRACNQAGEWGVWSSPVHILTRATILVRCVEVAEDFITVEWEKRKTPNPRQFHTGKGIVTSYHLRVVNHDGMKFETYLTDGECPYTIQGLSPDTYYNVEMKANYNNEEWGLWSSPLWSLTMPALEVQLSIVAEDFCEVLISRPSQSKRLPQDDGNHVNADDEGLVTCFGRARPMFQLCVTTPDKASTTQRNRIALKDAIPKHAEREKLVFSAELQGDGQSMRFKVPNLKPATNYHVNVRSRLPDGVYGMWSGEAKFATLAPLSISCTQIGEDFIAVDWHRKSGLGMDASASGSNPNQGVLSLGAIKRSRLRVSDGRAVIQTIDVDSEETHCVVSKLMPASTYVISVQTLNDDHEWGVWSDEAKARTLPGINVLVERVGEDAAWISWARDADAAPDISTTTAVGVDTGVKNFEMQIAGPNDFLAERVISGPNCFFRGLIPDSRYEVRVRGESKQGFWGLWAVREFRTLPTMRVTFGNIGEHFVVVEWRRHLPLMMAAAAAAAQQQKQQSAITAAAGDASGGNDGTGNNTATASAASPGGADGGAATGTIDPITGSIVDAPSPSKKSSALTTTNTNQQQQQQQAGDGSALSMLAENDFTDRFRLRVQLGNERPQVFELPPSISSFRLDALRPSSEYRVWICARGHEQVWGPWNLETRVRTVPQLALKIDDIGENYVACSWRRSRWESDIIVDKSDPEIYTWAVDSAVTAYHVKVLDDHGNVVSREKMGYTSTKCTINKLNPRSVYSVVVCSEDTYKEYGLWTQDKKFLTLEGATCEPLLIGESFIELHWDRESLFIPDAPPREDSDHIEDDTEAWLAAAREAEEEKQRLQLLSNQQDAATAEQQHQSGETGEGAAAAGASQNSNALVVAGASNSTNSKRGAINNNEGNDSNNQLVVQQQQNPVETGDNEVTSWHVRIYGCRLFGGLPGQDDFQEYIHMGDVTKMRIPDLQPHSSYSFAVRAKNTRNEWGAWSNAVTLETVPLLECRCSYVGEDFVEIDWKRPDGNNESGDDMKHLSCFPIEEREQRYQQQLLENMHGGATTGAADHSITSFSGGDHQETADPFDAELTNQTNNQQLTTVKTAVEPVVNLLPVRRNFKITITPVERFSSPFADDDDDDEEDEENDEDGEYDDEDEDHHHHSQEDDHATNDTTSSPSASRRKSPPSSASTKKENDANLMNSRDPNEIRKTTVFETPHMHLRVAHLRPGCRYRVTVQEQLREKWTNELVPDTFGEPSEELMISTIPPMQVNPSEIGETYCNISWERAHQDDATALTNVPQSAVVTAYELQVSRFDDEARSILKGDEHLAFTKVITASSHEFNLHHLVPSSIYGVRVRAQTDNMHWGVWSPVMKFITTNKYTINVDLVSEDSAVLQWFRMMPSWVDLPDKPSASFGKFATPFDSSTRTNNSNSNNIKSMSRRSESGNHLSSASSSPANVPATSNNPFTSSVGDNADEDIDETSATTKYKPHSLRRVIVDEAEAERFKITIRGIGHPFSRTLEVEGGNFHFKIDQLSSNCLYEATIMSLSTSQVWSLPSHKVSFCTLKNTQLIVSRYSECFVDLSWSREAQFVAEHSPALAAEAAALQKAFDKEDVDLRFELQKFKEINSSRDPDDERSEEEVQRERELYWKYQVNNIEREDLTRHLKAGSVQFGRAVDVSAFQLCCYGTKGMPQLSGTNFELVAGEELNARHHNFMKSDRNRRSSFVPAGVLGKNLSISSAPGLSPTPTIAQQSQSQSQHQHHPSQISPVDSHSHGETPTNNNYYTYNNNNNNSNSTNKDNVGDVGAPRMWDELPLLHECKIGSKTLDCVVRGLTPGVEYIFAIRSCNAAGEWGPWSEEQTIETLVPIDLRQSYVGEHYVNLCWLRMREENERKYREEVKAIKDWETNNKTVFTAADFQQMKEELSEEEYKEKIAELRQWKQRQRALKQAQSDIADGKGEFYCGTSTPPQAFILRLINEAGAFEQRSVDASQTHQVTLNGLQHNSFFAAVICADYGNGEYGTWSEPVRFLTQNLIHLTITYVGERFVDVEWRRGANRRPPKGEENVVVIDTKEYQHSLEFQLCVQSGSGPQVIDDRRTVKGRSNFRIERLNADTRYTVSVREWDSKGEWGLWSGSKSVHTLPAIKTELPDIGEDWAVVNWSRVTDPFHPASDPSVTFIPTEIVGFYLSVEEVDEDGRWANEKDNEDDSGKNLEGAQDLIEEDIVVAPPANGEPLPPYPAPEEKEPDEVDFELPLAKLEGRKRYSLMKRFSFDVDSFRLTNLAPNRFYHVRVLCQTTGGHLGAWSEDTIMLTLEKIAVQPNLIDEEAARISWNRADPRKAPAGVDPSKSRVIHGRYQCMEYEIEAVSWVGDEEENEKNNNKKKQQQQRRRSSNRVEEVGDDENQDENENNNNNNNNEDQHQQPISVTGQKEMMDHQQHHTTTRYFFSKVVPSNILEWKLVGLQIDGQYKVRIRSKDTRGRYSLWSENLHFATQQKLTIKPIKITENFVWLDWFRIAQPPECYEETDTPLILPQEMSAQYRLQVFVATDMTTSLLDKTFTGSIKRYQLGGLRPNTAYVIQVRGCNLAGEWGQWSEQRTVYTMKLISVDVLAVGEGYIAIGWKRDRPDELPDTIAIDSFVNSNNNNNNSGANSRRRRNTTDVNDLIDDPAQQQENDNDNDNVDNENDNDNDDETNENNNNTHSVPQVRRRYPLLDTPQLDETVYCTEQTNITRFSIWVRSDTDADGTVTELPASDINRVIAGLDPDCRYTITIRALYGDEDWGLWSSSTSTATLNRLAISVKNVGEDYLNSLWQRAPNTFPIDHLEMGNMEETLCYQFCLFDVTDLSDEADDRVPNVPPPARVVQDVLTTRRALAVHKLHPHRRYRLTVRRWYKPVTVSKLSELASPMEVKTSDAERQHQSEQAFPEVDGDEDEHDEQQQDDFEQENDDDNNNKKPSSPNTNKNTNSNEADLDEMKRLEKLIRSSKGQAGSWSEAVFVLTLRPMFCTAQEIAEDMINVRWQRDPSLTRAFASRPNTTVPVQIQSYHVRIDELTSDGLKERTGSGTLHFDQQFPPEETAFRVTDLRPDGVYRIQVRCCSDRAWGLWSKSCVALTLPRITVSIDTIGEDYSVVNWSRDIRQLRLPDGQQAVTGSLETVDKYQLEMYGLEHAYHLEKKFRASRTTYRVKRLEPETLYSISIRSCDDHGMWSLWSDKITFVTLKPLKTTFGKIGEQFVHINWKREAQTTAEYAHYSGGMNNAAGRRSRSPPQHNNNDDDQQQQQQLTATTPSVLVGDTAITSYHLCVFAVDQGPTTAIVDKQVPGDQLSYRVTGLLPGSPYIVIVRACNAEGSWGLWSEERMVTTLRLFEVSVVSVGENYISVKWHRDEDNNNNDNNNQVSIVRDDDDDENGNSGGRAISGYRVSVTGENQQQQAAIDERFEPAQAENNVFTVRGLTPDSKYTIGIQADYGDEEWGLWSAPVTFLTLNRLGILVSNITEERAEFTWGRAQQSPQYAFDPSIVVWKGTVIKYQVVIRRLEVYRRAQEEARMSGLSDVPVPSGDDANNDDVRVIEREMDLRQSKYIQTFCVVDRLQVKTDYHVQIRALDDYNMWGEWSEVLFDTPPNPPSHPTLRKIGANVLLLTWDPPDSTSRYLYCVEQSVQKDPAQKKLEASTKSGGGSKAGGGGGQSGGGGDGGGSSEWRLVDTFEEPQCRIRVSGPINKVRCRVRCCKLDRAAHLWSKYSPIVGLSAALPPEPVSTLQISAYSRTSATIEWTSNNPSAYPGGGMMDKSSTGGSASVHPSSPSRLIYRVLLSVRDQPAVLVTATRSTSYELVDLSPGTPYRVQVQVESDAGVSTRNPILKFTTKTDDRQHVGKMPMVTAPSVPPTAPSASSSRPNTSSTVAQGGGGGRNSSYSARPPNSAQSARSTTNNPLLGGSGRTSGASIRDRDRHQQPSSSAEYAAFQQNDDNNQQQSTTTSGRPPKPSSAASATRPNPTPNPTAAPQRRSSGSAPTGDYEVVAFSPDDETNDL